jgi:hypothetical protein
MTTLFDEWIDNRPLPSLGTNSGTIPIAFQRWHHFKEAFPPELIRRAIAESDEPVKACLDPFGGSGTTALACQFLGVASTTVEINPFLADVIRAKISPLNADHLSHTLGVIRRKANRLRPDPIREFRNLPKTFIQPGVSGRWLFSLEVAGRIAALRNAIESIDEDAQRRFFRILLGGVLVSLSNATVNGKGRRYRRNWQSHEADSDAVDQLFMGRCQDAIVDVHRFASRPNVSTSVQNTDSRGFRTKRLHDISVFSPPYPNSFDYTDVYNIELWMLGYLQSSDQNRRLRKATLSSHVQLQRAYAAPPDGSRTLSSTLQQLEAIKDTLWSPWIPSMVGAYFADLVAVLDRVHRTLRSRGCCWMVVGDSRYGGVFVPTGQVLTELLPCLGWSIATMDPFRSMRSSSQHGGIDELAETLVVLRKVG